MTKQTTGWREEFDGELRDYLIAYDEFQKTMIPSINTLADRKIMKFVEQERIKAQIEVLDELVNYINNDKSSSGSDAYNKGRSSHRRSILAKARSVKSQLKQ